MRSKLVVGLVIGAVGFGVPALLKPSEARAHGDGWRGVTHIKGKVVTGTNRFLGQPVWNFPAPLGIDGLEHLGALNTAGATPLPLTPATPKSAILVTSTDAGLGLTPADLDLGRLNVPLRQVPMNVTPDGKTQSAVPNILSAAVAGASQAEPAFPITLRDWGKARGNATIVCGDRGNFVHLKVESLLPNRLYTAWAVFGGSTIAARPLGGAPNVIVTDEDGDGTLSRRLNFCPTAPTAGQPPLLLIELVFHADQQNHGAVAQLHGAGKEASSYPGTVSFAQLDFPVTLLNSKRERSHDVENDDD